MRAEPHPDEERRLEALRAYGVLDTPFEKEFDDLVALAARICEAPISIVSLVDEGRQWFKSAVGLDIRETSLEASICAHAILGQGLIEVPDAKLDPRFQDNPLVAGDPELRFYAGAPLETPEGLPLGMLCVLDTKPRVLTDLQRETLRVLGRQAMMQLELRRKVRELEEAARVREGQDEFLRMVTDHLPVRVGYLDREYRFRFLNGEYERTFGLAPGTGIGKSVAEVAGDEAFLTAKSFLDRALAGETHTQEFSVRYAFGERRVEVQYAADVTPSGETRGIVVHVEDTTARKLAEVERERLIAELEIERGKLQTFFQLAPAFIAVLRGPNLVFEYVNDAYYAIVGHRPVVGLPLTEAIPEATHGGEGRDYDRLLLDIMESGDARTFNERPVTLQRTVGAPLEERFLDLAYLPLREADGEVPGILVHGIDVTDRVRASQQIAEREELFRTVFEGAADDAILVMDAERILTAWNPAAERITGWSAGETIGQKADFLFSAEDRQSGLPVQEIKGAARVGKAIDERWHMRKDGSRFWGSGTINALHDEAGSVRGFLKVFRDTTERYEETQTLAFLSLLTEAVIDEREAERIVETVERMLGQYLGASRVLYGEVEDDAESVVVRKEWLAFGGPSVLGRHRIADFGSQISADFRSGTTHVSRNAELDYTPGEGLEAIRSIGAAAGISVPIMKEGRLASLVVVHQDAPRDWTNDEIGLVRQVADRLSAEIERARAEEALRGSEERFRQLVELSPSTVWFGEPDGGLSYISQDFYDATGLTPNEALPNGWAATVHPEDLGRVAEDWETARREETTYDTEFRILHRDGVYRWISARALPLRDKEGHVTGWLGSNSDIHERKTAEATLQARVEERTEQLRAAVREAEGFNYSISHDLRTPLRAMVATSSILLEEIGETLSEEHQALLVRQAENAKRLGRLIDELLRLSRLARVPVNRARLDITAKVHSVVAELEQSGGLNGCRVEVQEAMTAEGDAGLVRTIFQNLVGNACKFSPHGGTVRIFENGGVFSVADEGVGFDLQFAPKIFQPFERLVSEAEFPGTGIGLANVKRIVERHGGKVWVESSPGNGATFSFTLG